MNTLIDNADERIKKIQAILSRQESRLSSEYEKRLIQIRECARQLFLLAKETATEDSASALIDEMHRIVSMRSDEFSFHQKMLATHKKSIGTLLSALHSQDKAVLACAVASELISEGYAFDVTDVIPVVQCDDAVIAYVKNVYSDIAYDELASCFNESRVLYCRNFDEACEQLFRENAGYCILPISSDEAGELVTVRKLLDMHSLKICAVCDVECDGGAVRYALISDKNSFIIYGEERFLEFSLTLDGAIDVSSICFAMEYCGLLAHKMQSIPNTLENAMSCRFEVLEREGDLLAFLIFLALFFGDYNLYGLYSKI